MTYSIENTFGCINTNIVFPNTRAISVIVWALSVPLMMDMDGLLPSMLVGLHDRRILMTTDLDMLKRISCQSIFENVFWQSYNSWFWDSGTPRLRDSVTPRLWDSGTPGLRDSWTSRESQRLRDSWTSRESQRLWGSWGGHLMSMIVNFANNVEMSEDEIELGHERDWSL